MAVNTDFKGMLEDLYSSYGYEKYRMAGFEEYSLYLENKNFLTSDKMITFNDLDGRLMALKPDVTLSIVKNALPRSGVGKYYYTESVYRPNKASDAFRELTQTGLEALGAVDEVTVTEAVELALKSLELAGAEYVLALSDVRFTEGLIHAIGKGEEVKEQLREIIAKKSVGEIKPLAEKYDLTDRDVEALQSIITLPAEPETALSVADKFAFGKEANAAIDELKALINAFSGTRYADKLQIDFSITGNTGYYNGVLFSGYILGVADAVLKGGRYDKLADIAGAGKGAIGFALYTDEIIEKYFSGENYPDMVIEYGDDCDTAALLRAADNCRAMGKKVLLSAGGAGSHGKKYLFKDGELIEE